MDEEKETAKLVFMISIGLFATKMGANEGEQHSTAKTEAAITEAFDLFWNELKKIQHSRDDFSEVAQLRRENEEQRKLIEILTDKDAIIKTNLVTK